MRADHGQAVEITFANQRLDVLNVQWCELWCELDDHPPCGQLQIKRVLRIQPAPVGGFGGRQDLRHRERRFGGLLRHYMSAPCSQRASECEVAEGLVVD